MKAIFFTGLFLLCMLLSYGQESFVIEGKTTGFADSTWLMLRNVELESVVDSTQIINNAFIFRGKVNGSENFVISTKFTGDPNAYQYKFLWIEPGTITLEGKSGDFRNAIVKGSEVQSQSDKLSMLTKHIEVKMDSLNNEFRKGTFSDTVRLAEARKLRSKLEKEEMDIKSRYIRDHPGYMYSAYILTYMMKTMDREQTRQLLDSLTPEIKASEHGLAVKNYIELNREFKVGDSFVDIHLPNANGEILSLSSFKGKYILLDFWASGCGPCRMEHPQLLKLYNEYKDKGFEIFAVSIDKSKNNWVQAMEKDGITWPNVSDLKGSNGQVSLTYGVYYIPNNYLIDPDGIIIAKDLRGKKLEEKIEALLK